MPSTSAGLAPQQQQHLTFQIGQLPLAAQGVYHQALLSGVGGLQGGMLPSLRLVLDGINHSQPHNPTPMHAMGMSQMRSTQQASHAHHLAAAQQQHSQLFQQQQQPPSSPGGAEGGDVGGDEGKHNKYCHFCQHVKVKRATSMLACVNQECARRFCEHCLVTHLKDAAPKPHEAAGWTCPICRKTCCCAYKTCDRTHRHCKAFRYRQRRAEQAAKRSLGAAGGGRAAGEVGEGGQASRGGGAAGEGDLPEPESGGTP